jgi:hypothetical protein
LAVPATHVVPLQQPFGQFCGLHWGGGVRHTPTLHTCPLATQFWQASPVKPHAVF